MNVRDDIFFTRMFLMKNYKLVAVHTDWEVVDY